MGLWDDTNFNFNTFICDTIKLTNLHYITYITQCYMPPGRGDIPAFIPAEAGTRLSDHGVAELT